MMHHHKNDGLPEDVTNMHVCAGEIEIHAQRRATGVWIVEPDERVVGDCGLSCSFDELMFALINLSVCPTNPV